MINSPRTSPQPDAESWQALPLAADTPAGLNALARDVARSLDATPEASLRDVAARVDTGRAAGPCRCVVVATNPAHAAALLRDPDPALVVDGEVVDDDRTTVFMFPGVGDHYAGMAADAYQQMPGFRAALDQASEILRPILGLDITAELYPSGTGARPPAAP